jgi:hypothetical protein
VLEHPLAFDALASGRIAALDRDGRRLCLAGGGAPDVALDLDFAGLRCRFRGDDVVVLGRGGELLSLAPDGAVRGLVRVREGALDLAVLGSLSVVVSYGRRGVPRHGVTLERLGDTPCVFHDGALLDATCLAAEAGGLWVAGTGGEAPTARAVRLRPAPAGFEPREVVALPSPPRAATVGPDGALHVLLEPGESVVRVHGGRAADPVRLPAPLHALARQGRRLLGCGPRGLEDVTSLVPRPAAAARPPALPPCSP